VAVASDKLRTFERFRASGIPHPQWTTDRREAATFFTSERTKVICRTLLRASEGRGIVIATNPQELVNAPLYVKFWPKQTEYRVHVFRGEIIDVAEKRLRNGWRENPNRNRYIRNYSNGWIFAHENVDLPGQAREVALQAVRSCGLDFGAVDLAINEDGDIAVFEINTAPGIEGQTIHKYVETIQRFCNQQ
jgi:glutathione synthase/RimK-type ligase-like ATP-grasp enzyme